MMPLLASPKFYLPMAGLSGVMVMAAGAYLYLGNGRESLPLPMKSLIIANTQPPADFFDTIPAPPPAPALPPTILQLPPVEKADVPLLPPPSQIFMPVTPPEPQIPPEELKRNDILRQALFTQESAKEIRTFEDLHREFYDKPYSEGAASRDTDFREQGIKSETASYPVKLERVLTMNKYIPAVLETEIESEVPSEKVIAMVEQDVVGFHGRKILIPKGSKAIGKYEAVVSPDSTRLGISWYRILTPEGINIKLTSEAVDAQGSSGLTGYVDNKWKDKYGSALLFSSISAMAQMSVPVDNNNAKAAADSFSNQLTPVVTEQLRRAMDIIPRINIPKGERINISPLVDIWFKEPKGNEIETEPYKEERE